MRQSKLTGFLSDLGLRFVDFKKFMIGQAVSTIAGEDFYFIEDIINFVAMYRSQDYPKANRE